MQRTHNALIFSVLCIGLVASVGCKKEPSDADKTPVANPATDTDPAPKVVTGSTETPTAGVGLASAAGKYKIDSVHSAVNFKIKHMNVSHTLGRFNKVKGGLNIAADLGASSVNIEVDAASVYTADKKRDEHLKGPDFLNTAQFPAIKFASKKIVASGDNRYAVTGDLTLHGVTKSVTAEFEHVGSGPNMMDKKIFLTGFTGTLTLKRTDFGMTNMVGPAGDDIELTIAIEAMRQ